MSVIAYKWIGDPFLVKRNQGGHIMFVGKNHMVFDTDGNIEQLNPITPTVLRTILKQVYGQEKAAAQAVAFLKPISQEQPSVPQPPPAQELTTRSETNGG